MYLLSRQAGQTLLDHRDSAWIAGCDRCRRDEIIVEQSLVAAGLGVTTIPGLALRSHRRPGLEATEIPHFRRRVHLATYGEPPDPPATAAFVTALQDAAADYAYLDL
jgi:DNA-binding transcriptional LysR family regulator